MKRKIIACDVMKEELAAINSEGAVDYEYLPMGLHDFPEKLRTELQAAIDRSPGYDMVILGFGLCGNAMRDIVASHCRLVIPRVHECIPLFFGCKKTYDEIRQGNPGTYFLTGGWTEDERSTLKEYARVSEKFGPEEAREIFDMLYKSYNTLMFVSTCHPRLDSAREYAKKVAAFLKLDFTEAKGQVTGLEKLVNGPWSDDEFISVDKGAVVSEEEFYRRSKN